MDELLVQRGDGSQYELVRSRLHGRGLVTQTRDRRVTAKCPAHDDRNPSLTLDEGRDGLALVRCHAGCTYPDVVSALGLTMQEVGTLAPMAPSDRQSRTAAANNDRGGKTGVPLVPVPIDAPSPTFRHPRHRKPTGIWKYTDSAGGVLMYTCRFDRAGKKQILPYTFRDLNGGTRGWRWAGLAGMHPIFGQKRLADRPDAPVLLVEGEKTAVAATELFPNHVPVTWAGGAGTVTKVDWTPLAGRRVTIWPDNDDPGRVAMEKAASSLVDVGAHEIRCVEIPRTFTPKWDLADSPPDGWDSRRLRSLVDNARPHMVAGERQSTHEALHVLTIRELLEVRVKPREQILAPWLPAQGLAMVHAYRGTGKTYVALGIAVAVAAGGRFLRWHAPRPRSVLYIDGEMPAQALQERFARTIRTSEVQPAAALRIVTPDFQDLGMPNLAGREGQRTIESCLEGVDLLIVDHLSALCRGGRENEAESWLPVQEWGLKLRSQGVSVLFLHHSGKTGLQRGTSRREDVLDSVIQLSRAADYSPAEGAAFEVHFEKARGFHGDDARPFEAHMETLGDAYRWTVKDLELSTAGKVARLLEEGMNQKDIADELSITKGAVSKAKKKAIELGLYVGGGR